MLLKKCKFILISLFFFTYTIHITGQQQLPEEISAILKNDTLYLKNKQISFTYYWNKGNIVLKEAQHNPIGQKLQFPDHQTPNLYLPGEIATPTNTKITISEKQTFPTEYWHKEVAILYKLGDLEVKHLIKIYANTSAISHTYFLKGKATSSTWIPNNNEELQMIEKNKEDEKNNSEHIASIPFDKKHWKSTIVSFKEATDYHDNLVSEKIILPYRKKENHQGNILLATHPEKQIGFFLLKEAPIANSQQYYPGYDFQIDDKTTSVHGIGISPKDLGDEWIQGYGYAIGLSKSDKIAFKKAVLQYQKQLRKYIPQRDAMILANTWGDRSKDSRMNEAFIVKEIEQASTIGITHLQLDDGWQTGLSRNSASKAGKKWDDWSTEDWQPHPKRFPNGFEPIIKTAKEKKVEICLWFNPSKTNSYQLWERDADILIEYYRRYGIKVFKIDGISFTNKQSEVNLRKLFTKVMTQSKGQVTFNMDVTAGHRVGYHFFNEFGNVFLENRYTDWGNYYPHRTLRNLWQLSGYVPTERLQIEFLNNSRNQNKYPKDDHLAPGKIPLTYTSAITLVAQPLAWMELSNLKNIGNLKDQFSAYKKIADDLHSTIVLPIGKEPSGFSWAGFITYHNDVPKYIVAFREYTKNDDFEFKIKELKKAVKINRILGNDISALQHQKNLSIVKISTPKQFNYGLFLIE